MSRSTPLLALLLAAGFAFADPAPAQQAPPPESGIWIADSAGRLRPVVPADGIAASPGAARPAAPEPLRVVVEVESTARSASGALAANQLAVARVIRATAALGGAAGGTVSGTPVVIGEPPRGSFLARSRTERPEWFRAVTQLEMEATDPRRLGALLDAAMAAGATQVVSAHRR
jgi:uncharacterized protein YggE